MQPASATCRSCCKTNWTQDGTRKRMYMMHFHRKTVHQRCNYLRMNENITFMKHDQPFLATSICTFFICVRARNGTLAPPSDTTWNHLTNRTHACFIVVKYLVVFNVFFSVSNFTRITNCLADIENNVEAFLVCLRRCFFGNILNFSVRAQVFFSRVHINQTNKKKHLCNGLRNRRLRFKGLYGLGIKGVLRG